MRKSSVSRYWFIVPAAGIGARMNADRPKQYLLLNDKTILEHTLQRLLTMPNVAGIVVVVGKHDAQWKHLTLSDHSLIHTVEGGAERANSVLNGLNYLADKARAEDWVLVHDAARPCVTQTNITLLMDALENSDVGGILAIPVSDTIKFVENNHGIQTTLDRRSLWQAQTPQMFRYALLRDCLMQSLNNNEIITDESSAVELCGFIPQVIQGRSDNIKITRADDLWLAEFILQQQKTSH